MPENENSSKHEPKTQLYGPPAARVRYHAKIRRPERVFRQAEIRVIESVEQLDAQLQRPRRGERHVLGQGDVEVDDAVAAENAASGCRPAL